jgi:alanine racemase
MSALARGAQEVDQRSGGRSLSRGNAFHVDLGAIAHNVREVRRLVGSDVWMCVALKGNAYGFGLLPVARSALLEGADAVSVADVAEAITLREHGINSPILLYPGNLPTPTVLDAIQKYDLIPTIIDDESLRAYTTARLQQPRRVFMKVDVGLERLGIDPSAVTTVARKITDSRSLSFDGIYTHFDVVDDPDAVAYLEWQYERFSAAIRELQTMGLTPRIQMAAASGALAITTSMNLNAVDPGHVIYGLQPPGPRLVPLKLNPAFKALTSQLIQVKHVRRERFLDKLPFPSSNGLKIGVVPMGRRDGLATANAGIAIVHGSTCPLGSVDLEHTRVDLTDVPDAAVGDEVVLIGTQQQSVITLEEVAAHQQLPALVDVSLAIRESVQRRYFSTRELPDLPVPAAQQKDG